MKSLLIAALLCLFAGVARADTVWTYQGNSTSGNQAVGQLNPCGCALDGTLTLDANNLVTSYSFTDGAVTLNQANSAMVLYPFNGGSAGFGLFTEWYLHVTDSSGDSLFSVFYGSTGEATDSGTGGLFVEGNRGSWVDPISTPEPRTIALLGLGLAALTLLRRLA